MARVPNRIGALILSPPIVIASTVANRGEEPTIGEALETPARRVGVF